jgi:Tol biopolymer transport system component
MRRVIRRGLGVGLLALLLAASTALAAAPPGPRLAVVRVSAKPPRLELLTVNRNGGDLLRLAGGGRRARPLLDYFSPVAWFPDGERIAFSGIVRFEEGDDQEAIQKVFTVRADGSGLRAIRGTKEALAPVPAPDGRTLAFTRTLDRETPTTVGRKRWEEGFHGSSVWTLDLETAKQRQLTPWRDGLRYSASSFSPNGSTLLVTLEDDLHSEPQPVALDLAGGGQRPLFDDGSSPVYSPDGSRIALVREIEEYGDDRGRSTDLFVINPDGTGLRRLTRTPGLSELSPTWDPSGERLAYARLPLVRSEEAPFGYSNALMQINADGTCQTRVAAPRPSFSFVPSWQPGPGRGAGRIEC